MPNFSGIWTVTQQMQARGASTWPATPGAPTIGTATAGINNCASVTFTAPACTGYPAGVTGYRVVSTPGCVTQTGASSPLVVTGLTTSTSYTFKAQATNSTGYGALSAASNSITAALATCATFVTAGTFSWVAPAGVTSVAVLAIGPGGGCATQAGGGLGFTNGYSVTPGNSYAVNVGAAGVSLCHSYFVSTAVVKGGAPQAGFSAGGCYTGTGGGIGGAGGYRGGGGAGGYTGTGGAGGAGSSAGSAGAGGGGGGGGSYYDGVCLEVGGGGGGVGLYGAGSNGAGGSSNGNGGGGGSGGVAGTNRSGGTAGSGGLYGGGRGNGTGGGTPGLAARGAVRIVWAGGARGTPSFPSTCVGA